MIDIEALLIAWLEDNIEDVTASTETPADLDARLLWILVRRVTGPYDGFRIDRPSVDIGVFAATGPAAAALAIQIQVLLHRDLKGQRYGDAVVSYIRTSTAPHSVPYDNPNMRRYEANNEFAVHPA
ncbi:hypothetical protein [Acrocarpospora sp. B8E8]|uniref:hypothetical protein n=1 Tax=Acrocarpospora sp. B8E8 TaxID=3153572 RepID=UPI00325EA40C